MWDISLQRLEGILIDEEGRTAPVMQKADCEYKFISEKIIEAGIKQCEIQKSVHIILN
jgi:hypothetical protein